MGNHADELFQRFVAKSQMVTAAQLAECRTALDELNADSEQVTLKELLLQRGYLAPADAVRVEKMLKLEDSRLDAPGEGQLGGYKVLTRLGQGGMASVYLAKADARDEYVALKVLHKDVCERSDIVERMIRETRALFQLEHPNIVRGHEFGNIDGRFYLAMEFVEGETLKSYVKKKGTLAEVEALELVEQIGTALAYAHRSGFVHRDIKPRNLIVNPEGQVKILDFGLSKSLLNEEQELTQDGHLLGTVLYASPEQLRGAKEVDSRADIYSLGITLYFMLIGEVPFRGATTTATAALHFESPLPDIQQKRPELSDGVKALVERMTAKAPEERYQTPAELLDDIRRVKSGASIAAPSSQASPSTAVSTPVPGRLALMVALLLLGAFLVYYIRTEWNTAPGKKQIDGTSESEALAPEPLPDSQPRQTAGGPMPEELATLESHVRDLLKKGEFAEAASQFDSLPAALFMPPWSSKVAELKAEVFTRAREELTRRKLKWLPLSQRQKLRAIEEFSGRLPPSLRKELAALKKQIEEAARVAQLRAPALTPEQELARKEPARPASPEAGKAGRTAPTAKGHAVKPPPPPTGKTTRPGETRTAPKTSHPPPVQAPEKALMQLAQSAFREKKWQRALELTHLVLGKYEKSKLVAGRKDDLLTMKFRCESELAPVSSFFAGRVRHFDAPHLEIEYDFSAKQQLDDWVPTQGRWFVDSGKLGRTHAGKGDLIWWRHPLGEEFRLEYEAQGLTYLSAVVAGNGLTANDGTGYVCGLGHVVGSQAVIQTRPKPPLARKNLLVNLLHLYTVSIFRKDKWLHMESGRSVHLRARLREGWQIPDAGNGPRLGLFGWDDNQTRYEKVTIETDLSPDWLKAERSRVFMQKMAQAHLLKTNHFLSFRKGKEYAIVPARSGPLLGNSWTIEFWFRVDQLARKQKATLLAVGAEGNQAMIMLKNSGREIQFGFRLGSASGVINVEKLDGWQHLAFCLDDERGNLFLNGKRLRHSFLVKSQPRDPLPIILGYSSEAGLIGAIDDVRISSESIYSSVFTPERPLAATATTTHLYLFDESSGNAAHDAVAGGTSCYLFGPEFTPADRTERPPAE